MKKISTAVLIFIIFIACTLNFIYTINKGITWDEPVFFAASSKIVNWIFSFNYNDDKKFQQTWAYDYEHPPLSKFLFGITYKLLNKKLNFIWSFRFFNSFMLLIFLIILCFKYLKYSSFKDKIIFILLIFLNLRLIYFTQIASKEFLSTVFYCGIILYLSKIELTYKTSIILALLTGFSLLIKINNILILPIIFLYTIFYSKNKIKFLSIIFIISGLCLYLFWPWLWNHPLTKFIHYLKVFEKHFYIPTYFLGQTYENPPFYYPIIMTIFTLPVIILFFLFLNFSAAIKESIHNKKISKFHFCMLSGIVMPILFISLPGSPRYDGARLFISSFLLISIFAGDFIIKYISNSTTKNIIIIILALTVYYNYYKYHPYENSYYSEIIGGIKGANHLGLETQYWGESFNFKILNKIKKLPKGSSINIHPVSKYLVNFYRQLGSFPDNINYSGSPYDYYILLSRQGLWNNELWKLYLERKPIYSIKLDGVQILGIYSLH